MGHVLNHLAITLMGLWPGSVASVDSIVGTRQQPEGLVGLAAR